MADTTNESKKPTKVVSNADPELYNRFQENTQSRNARLDSFSGGQPVSADGTPPPHSNPLVPSANPLVTNDIGSGSARTNPADANHADAVPVDNPQQYRPSVPSGAEKQNPTTGSGSVPGDRQPGVVTPSESPHNPNTDSRQTNPGMEGGAPQQQNRQPSTYSGQDTSIASASAATMPRLHQSAGEGLGTSPDLQAATRESKLRDLFGMSASPTNDGNTGTNQADAAGTTRHDASPDANAGPQNSMSPGRNAGSDSPSYEKGNSQDTSKVQSPLLPQAEVGQGSFTSQIAANAGNAFNPPVDKGIASAINSSAAADAGNVALMGMDSRPAGSSGLDYKNATAPTDSKTGPNATTFDAKSAPLSIDSTPGVSSAIGASLDAKGSPLASGADAKIGNATNFDAKGSPLAPGADAKIGNATTLDTKGSSSTTGADAKPLGATGSATDAGVGQTRKETDARSVDPKIDSGRLDTNQGKLTPPNLDSGRLDTNQGKFTPPNLDTGRSDTNQGKFTPPALDTGRSDSNTGAATRTGGSTSGPLDGKSTASGFTGTDGKGIPSGAPGLDGRIGTKSDTGAGGGVPIVMPGVPDILGGLKGMVVRNDGKADNDAVNPKGTKSEGTRESGESGARSGSGKTTSLQDGRGGKDGIPADGKSTDGAGRGSKDGITADGGKVADGGRGGKDGTSTGNRVPTDGATSGASGGGNDGLTGGKAVDGGKSSGWRGDVPILPPGSLPVPDLTAGLKNIGERLGLDPKGNKAGGDPGVRSDGAKTPISDRTGKGDAAADGKGPDGKGSAGKAQPLDGKAPVDGKAPAGGVLDGKMTAGAKENSQHGDTGRGGRGDIPILPPGSLPVPDIAAGLKNLGERLGFDPKGIKSTGEGPSTVVTGGARVDAGKMPALPDGRQDRHTGKGTGDGPSTVVTGGTRADAGKTPALHDGRGDKNVGVPGIPVPLDAVPLKFLAGNLKAISERIFPSAKSQENTSGPRPKFEASLPGRQTVRLVAIKNPTDANRTPAIPIERSMGPVTQRLDGQFMMKSGDITLRGRVAATEQSAAKTKLDQPESKHPAPLDQPRAKAPDRPSAPLDQTRTKHEHAPHAESAEERLLANFELVLEESPARLEAEEAEGTEAPPPPIESLEREDVILPEEEEEVQFDGPITEEENAPSRYQYTVEPGDTVELVAIKTLNNISLAPLIYQINRDTIPIGMKNGQMVFALKPGTTIWLPFPKEIAAFQQQ